MELKAQLTTNGLHTVFVVNLGSSNHTVTAGLHAISAVTQATGIDPGATMWLLAVSVKGHCFFPLQQTLIFISIPGTAST